MTELQIYEMKRIEIKMVMEYYHIEKPKDEDIIIPLDEWDIKNYIITELKKKGIL